MISKASFEKEHIRELQTKSHRDPILIERVIYAFGLLEALVKVGLPFIFKGGTCLLLILEKPRRLSTDIDIIVAPGTDIDEYIKKASEIFPFISEEEDVRRGRNNIVKRHFKFTYDSPVNGKPFYILLDVLFEENHYQATEEKAIDMEMLLSEGEPYKVTVPSVDCILADKLTAFAPYTTGIPLRAYKDMEVMKQLYDVASLIDVFGDFGRVSATYRDICASEISYRGTDITPDECLMNTFEAAACVASRGTIRSEDYPLYVKAARDLHDHIFIENFSAEVAATISPKVMYMALCLLQSVPFTPVEDYREYSSRQISSDLLKPLKSLRKASPMAYAYVIKADELYQNIK